MKILITGATGFVGSHLIEYISANHSAGRIFALCYQPPSVLEKLETVSQVASNWSHSGRQTSIECNLLNSAHVDEIMAEVKPDYIFHLAAQSFVGVSWDAPVDTFQHNVVGTLHLLQAIRKANITPRILITGSSEEYGLVGPDEVPVKESQPFRPLSPYAVSKVAQDLTGYQFFKSYQMPIIRVRSFNHAGPRQRAEFVVAGFAKQISDIEKNKGEAVIQVGNLDAVRDFTDVRDVIRAYWLLMEAGTPGEVYNVCSGHGRSVRSILDTLLTLAATPIEVKIDPHRLRPSDIPCLIGDNTHLCRLTGWQPLIPFETTLIDTLNYWRLVA